MEIEIVLGSSSKKYVRLEKIQRWMRGIKRKYFFFINISLPDSSVIRRRLSASEVFYVVDGNASLTKRC